LCLHFAYDQPSIDRLGCYFPDADPDFPEIDPDFPEILAARCRPPGVSSTKPAWQQHHRGEIQKDSLSTRF